MDRDWRDRMREIADRKLISAADISRKTGIARSTLSQLLSKKRNTKLEKIKLIADALDVTSEYLTHGIDREAKTTTTLKIPVLKESQVMQWISELEVIDQDKLQWINCCMDDCSATTFAMKVIDEDMIDLTGQESFPPGTIIFVDPELNPFNDGDEVAIGLLAVMQLEDGTIIFRELQRATGRWYAAPKNIKYESIPINLGKTKFIGTVLAQFQQYVKHNMI